MADESTDQVVPVQDIDPNLLSNVIAATQAAQQLHEQGVRIVPPIPPSQSPLNLQTLLRLNPRQALNYIASQPPGPSKEQTLYNRQNQQEIAKFLLTQQTRSQLSDEKKKEIQQQRDNAAQTFADQWGDAIEKNKAVSAQAAQAHQDFEDLQKKADQARGSGAVSAPTLQGKPAPREGVHVVPFKVLPILEDPATNQKLPPDKQFANQKLANALTDAATERAKVLNQAIEDLNKRTAATKELERQSHPKGFYVHPDMNSIIDATTRRTYPLPAQSKRYQYDQRTGRLIPK